MSAWRAAEIWAGAPFPSLLRGGASEWNAGGVRFRLFDLGAGADGTRNVRTERDGTEAAAGKENGTDLGRVER